MCHQIAQQVNPNMNIVFIRIFPQDNRGNVMRNGVNVNSTVRQALEWVAKNKTKLLLFSDCLETLYRIKSLTWIVLIVPKLYMIGKKILEIKLE